MDHPGDPRAGSGSALSPRPSRWSRLRERLRPPRTLRPTRAGWLFFAITFGVGFAALNTGNNLLYLVLSLMLAFLVLSGVLSEASLRGIAVRRRLPRELFAGAPGAVGLEIANTQRRVAAFAVVVEDRVRALGGRERAAGRAFALRAGPGECVRRAYSFQPEARGELEFTRFQVFTRFPFGLFSKSLELPASERTLVFPAVEPVSVPPDFGGVREAGEGVTQDRGRGVLAAGIRSYEPGDPLRRIHWPSSLRRGELFVRELESEHEAEVEVRLATAGRRPGERFEQEVSWAASEVVALLERGLRVALRTDAEHIGPKAGPGQRGRLLSFLASVAPGLAEGRA